MSAPSEPAAPKRILYIDDDEGYAFVLKSVLEQCGHQVTTYAKPAAALMGRRLRSGCTRVSGAARRAALRVTPP